mgnify:CR=1 FL=1
MLYTKCSFFYGCQWPLLGPKNVKLAWKFLMDVIKDEEKICHMDNRSGQWAKVVALHYGRNTCSSNTIIFSILKLFFPRGEKNNMWHFLDSAKLHSMLRSWPYIHLVYFVWRILIFPREIVLDSMRNCIPSAIDLKAITLQRKEAKTFWQFCFYAWVVLATLMVTNKQINCCQECHSGFTIESRCSTGIPATQILIFVLSHIPSSKVWKISHAFVSTSRSSSHTDVVVNTLLYSEDLALIWQPCRVSVCRQLFITHLFHYMHHTPLFSIGFS